MAESVSEKESILKRAAKFLLRIAAATLALLLVLLVVLGIAIRRPSLRKTEYSHGVRSDPSALRSHVEKLCEPGSFRNHADPAGLEKARSYVLEKFLELQPSASVTEFTSEGETFRNISARFGPTGGELLVIGAHYDSWGDMPGADDNASGVAALIELARLFSVKPPKVPVELVAYDSEEPPYFGGRGMGSAFHARELKRGGVKVRGMVCLEMIGFYAERQPMVYFVMSLIYPKKGDFIGVVGGFKDNSLAQDFKAGIKGAGGVRAVSYTGPNIIGVDLSDHRNYWSEGYRAVMITDTAFMRNLNYHTEKDLPGTLDYVKMAAVVDGVFNTVLSYGK